MKETIKINLNQRLFDLDADAYSALKEYLDSLKKYFGKNQEEAEEILQDIEQRIAEVLSGKLQAGKQVIILEDIREVISVMGTPADFAENEQNSSEKSDDTEDPKRGSEFNKDRRRLYRDLDSNLLGGVCSGISSYFNVDPLWIRLAFIILLFLNGIGALIYIILWVVVPAAVTTGQKLQMRGRPVTVENIQESVKAEYEKVKGNMDRYTQSESYQRTRETANEIVTILGRIVLVTIKVILIIIGVCLGISIIAFLLAALGIISIGSFNLYPVHHLDLIDRLEPLFNNYALFGLALTAVIFIPLIAILTGIFKLVLNIRRRHGIISAFAWTLWSLSLVYVIVAVLTGKSFAFESYSQHRDEAIEISIKKPLYIQMGSVPSSGWETSHFMLFGREIVRDNIEDICYLRPSVFIKSTTEDQARLRIENVAAIPDFDDFSDDLNYHSSPYYDYDWALSDTILVLDKYFKIDDKYLWQVPAMRITIFLPEGQRVVVDNSLKDALISESMENDSLGFSYEKQLIMHEGRLAADVY